MRILLTGATGYIGQRLLIALLNDGHEVVCCVRDKKGLILKNTTAINYLLSKLIFLKKKPLQTFLLT